MGFGFWQMKLDEASSDLTTFMTPFGRFKFNRVPFGINSAPEMFQRNMVQIFGDLPNVIIYFNDIGVLGESFEEHDETLLKGLKRAKLNGIRFNPDKVQYRRAEIEFMGHVLSEGTIKPQRKHLKANEKIKAGVLRILGLYKYLAKFIPDLSSRTAKLRNLTRLDTPFEWTTEHQNKLNDLLKTITSYPVSAVYDEIKPIVIQTGALIDGLGCVPTERTPSFATRTLTKTEQKWA